MHISLSSVPPPHKRAIIFKIICRNYNPFCPLIKNCKSKLLIYLNIYSSIRTCTNNWCFIFCDCNTCDCSKAQQSRKSSNKYSARQIFLTKLSTKSGRTPLRNPAAINICECKNYFKTFISLPTFVKAAIHLSKSARE